MVDSNGVRPEILFRTASERGRRQQVSGDDRDQVRDGQRDRGRSIELVARTADPDAEDCNHEHQRREVEREELGRDEQPARGQRGARTDHEEHVQNVGPPITLPSASSPWPLLTAVIAVTNSGSDVPNATSVAAMIASGIRNRWAVFHSRDEDLRADDHERDSREQFQ